MNKKNPKKPKDENSLEFTSSPHETNSVVNGEKQKVLTNNAIEYFNAGEEELKKDRNNSAVVLYFKCLISLCDLYILNKIGESPSSHTTRFKILREKFPKVYDIVDKDFPFYQGSYVQIMTKELAEVIREDAKIMAEKTKVKL